MIESEWFACAAPVPMLEAMSARGTPPDIVHAVARHVLLTHFPSGHVPDLPYEYFGEWTAELARIVVQRRVLGTAPLANLAGDISFAFSDSGFADHRTDADLVREIVGNPFRPAAVRPEWRTSDVRLLAEGIRYERAFDRMLILADALQDAGCDDETILAHCRDPNATHHTECWVMRLLEDPNERVTAEVLRSGARYRIARVNNSPGYSDAVFLGRESEGGMYRFAIAGSQEVIAFSARDVEARVRRGSM
jgi:hypothetical protein